eukprot:jgi/Chrzof1/14875/Cz09g19060.t1
MSGLLRKCSSLIPGPSSNQAAGCKLTCSRSWVSAVWLTLCVVLMLMHPCFGQPMTAATFTNLGGTGTYQDIASMSSSAWPPPCNLPEAQRCARRARTVSGPLQPFGEVTMVFRGPMKIANIGVYYPTATGWQQVSYYQGGTSPSRRNLSWMSNSGGGTCGAWSVCNGNSQAFMAANGVGQSSTCVPQIFVGTLTGSQEAHILTEQLCNKPAVCGYAYGNNTGIKPVAMEGFTGDAAGQKMFVFSVQMPAATAAGEPNYPAVWMLNARLSRLINCCTSTHTASLQSHQVPSHQGPRALSLALA